MTIHQLSDALLATRIDTVEALIHQTKETKRLKVLNELFQALIDEQVRRELERDEAARSCLP